MAHYIQFKSKATGLPVALNTLDAEICASLGVTPDPIKYYAPNNGLNWFDAIGWGCINKTLRELADQLTEDGLELGKVIKWIDSNYELGSWFS